MIYTTSDRAKRALAHLPVGASIQLAGGFLVEREPDKYRLYHKTNPRFWVCLGSASTILAAWEREAEYCCCACAGDGCDECSGAGRVVEARLQRAIRDAEAVLG